MRTFSLPRVYVTLDGQSISLPTDDTDASGIVRAVAETANIWQRYYLGSIARETPENLAAIRAMVVRCEADIRTVLDAWRIETWQTESVRPAIW